MKRKNPYRYYLIVWIVLIATSLLAINHFLDLQAVLNIFASINISTFLLFGLDKWQSGRRGMRVPEKILYLITLLGGSPGTLLGMQVFRHKTRKTSFQLIVAILIMVQIGLIVTFYKPNVFL